MVEREVIYELQISNASAEDSGSYSCCSGATVSSGSLVVNGRTKTMFIFSSHFHPFITPLFFHRTTLPRCHPWTRTPCKTMIVSPFVLQPPELFSLKSLKTKRRRKGTVWACAASSPKLVLPWSGGEENSVFAPVQSTTLGKQGSRLHLWSTTSIQRIQAVTHVTRASVKALHT